MRVPVAPARGRVHGPPIAAGAAPSRRGLVALDGATRGFRISLRVNAEQLLSTPQQVINIRRRTRDSDGEGSAAPRAGAPPRRQCERTRRSPRRIGDRRPCEVSACFQLTITDLVKFQLHCSFDCKLVGNSIQPRFCGEGATNLLSAIGAIIIVL